MIPQDKKAVRHSIERYEKEQKKLSEKKELYLYEGARLIVNELNENSEYSLPGAVSDIFAKIKLLPEDEISLCRYIATAPDSAQIVPSFIGTEETEIGEKIAYLRSSYADSAYRIFSSFFKEPTAGYEDSFEGVCESVYFGRAAMCILPIESNTEGRLTAFSALIKKYDLKLYMGCYVKSQSDDKETLFGLLKRSVSVADITEKRCAGKRLELTLISDDAGALPSLLFAAESFSMSVLGIETLPEGFSPSGRAYDIVFSLSPQNLTAFLCYLDMKNYNFNINGIYKLIK